MTEVFVEVRGGVLVESYSNNRDVVVKVIDWDNINEDCGLSFENRIPCLPIEQMPEETLAAARKIPLNS